MGACQAKELPVSLSFSFVPCSPMKIGPRQAEKNKKASSLYRLRQSTIAEKKKRCAPLRRNVAEKPRGMRLKFVLSQLRTCTHGSENMFVFFTSLRFYGEQESVWSNPVKLGGVRWGQFLSCSQIPLWPWKIWVRDKGKIKTGPLKCM